MINLDEANLNRFEKFLDFLRRNGVLSYGGIIPGVNDSNYNSFRVEIVLHPEKPPAPEPEREPSEVIEEATQPKVGPNGLTAAQNAELFPGVLR